MNKLAFVLAAAATLLVAAPALSQVSIRAGDQGVGIRVGPRDSDRVYRRHRRDECRTIIVRKRMPDGTRVTRKTLRCG